MKVMMVGSGVVGEATGTVLAQHGTQVVFTDVNPGVVERLRQQGYQACETQQVENPDADMYMIAVPSYPLDLCADEAVAARLEETISPLEWCERGIEFIKSAANTIGRWLGQSQRYSVVVVRSAVLPLTTKQLVMPALERQSGKHPGDGFGVCVNPEYLRERTAVEDIAHPWVTVIGEFDKRSGDMLESVYRWADCPQYRISLEEAELQKFIHNLCNAAKISFFNEMRLVGDRIGIDAEKVIPIVARSAEALWNPEYGTRAFGPFGGKCLPKDSVAFLAWARRQQIETKMMAAVLEVNQLFEKRLQGVTV